VTILFNWKILLTRQFSLLTGYEGVNQAYAWLNFQIHSIRNGVLPLWDPYAFSGHLFSGETQTGAFYPLYFLAALSPLNRRGLFPPALYHIAYAAIHFLAAYFTYLLVRRLGLSVFAGILAGICFSLGGTMGRLNEWPHLLNSGLWLPLVFLFVLKSLEARDATKAAANAAISGCFLALAILAGGIHFAIMQALVVATAVTYGCFRDCAANPAERRKAARRAGLIVGVAGVVAFCGGAIQLLPSAEYSLRAVRFVGETAVPASGRIPYYYLRDNIFASGITAFAVAAGQAQTGDREVINFYFGLFPLLLSGIAVWKGWAQPWVRYLLFLAVGAFVYSLGSSSLLHGVLYAVVPLLSVAREADRFMYLADFALAILAAYGVDILLSRGKEGKDEWERLRTILKWIALAALVSLLLSSMYKPLELSPWVSISVVMAAACWPLFRCITLGQKATSARLLLLSFVLFDLSTFDWSATNLLQLAAAKNPNQMDRLVSCDGVARFLKSRSGLFRAQFDTESPPNIGDAYSVQTTQGAGVTLLKDYGELLARPDLLNVRFVIRPASAAEKGAVYQDAAWKVYENAGAFRRAWLVHDTIVEAQRQKALIRIHDPAIDLHRVAIVESALPEKLMAQPGGVAEQVSFQHYDSNAMDLKVIAAGRALLVLSELDYPGWSAAVNGQPARIWRTDGLLRGIVIPPGESRVVMRYRPMSIYVGGALTLITLLAVVVIGALSVRRNSSL
jgi:hypothetical protein